MKESFGVTCGGSFFKLGAQKGRPCSSRSRKRGKKTKEEESRVALYFARARRDRHVRVQVARCLLKATALAAEGLNWFGRDVFYPISLLLSPSLPRLPLPGSGSENEGVAGESFPFIVFSADGRSCEVVAERRKASHEAKHRG